MKFAELTGDQQFKTACTGRIGTGSSTTSLAPDSFGLGLRFGFTAATNTWNIAGRVSGGSTIATQFGPADKDAAAPANVTAYRRKPASGADEVFYLGAPQLGGLPADYVRIARLFTAGAGGGVEFYRCVFGVPTPLTDKLPSVANPAGFISYANYLVSGDAYVVSSGGTAIQYALDRTIVDFRADPRTGGIVINMTLKGRQVQGDGSLSATETDLGKISAGTSIDGSEQNFSNAYVTDQAAGPISGTFGGWFFGPSGKELGYVFNAMQQRSDMSRLVIDAAVTASGQGEFVPA